MPICASVDRRSIAGQFREIICWTMPEVSSKIMAMTLQTYDPSKSISLPFACSIWPQLSAKWPIGAGNTASPISPCTTRKPSNGAPNWSNGHTRPRPIWRCESSRTRPSGAGEPPPNNGRNSAILGALSRFRCATAGTAVFGSLRLVASHCFGDRARCTPSRHRRQQTRPAGDSSHHRCCQNTTLDAFAVANSPGVDSAAFARPRPRRRNCLMHQDLRRLHGGTRLFARDVLFLRSTFQLSSPEREDVRLAKSHEPPQPPPTCPPRSRIPPSRLPCGGQPPSAARWSRSRSTSRLPTTSSRPTPWSIPEDELDETLDDEHDIEHTGEDDQIDDPVRIYLMQMGEIPMLSRQEETAVAKRIERSRRRFRYCMLATDYVLQAAIGLLENIRDNKLRLDRTIEVSVINLREKARLLKVLDAEPADAAPPDAAEQARLRAGHQPPAADEAAPRRPGGGC